VKEKTMAVLTREAASPAVDVAPGDLVMVLLVRDEPGAGGPVPTLVVSRLGGKVRVLAGLGIQAGKVFASTARRDLPAAAAWKSPAGLMGQAIREIKDADPTMTVITETCLCSYTRTGECHLTSRSGKADVPGTVAALAEQAVAQADAGTDIVGPAAMVRGSVRAVRQALDHAGHAGTGVMPHLIFDSRLYDRYRRAMGAVPAPGDARPFQESRPGRVTPWALGWRSSPRAPGCSCWSLPSAAPASRLR
jgi:porphobilinogen synthase